MTITKKQFIVITILSIIATSLLAIVTINNNAPATTEDYNKLKEIILEISNSPLDKSNEYKDVTTNIELITSTSKLVITATKSSRFQVTAIFPINAEYNHDTINYNIIHEKVTFVEKDLQTPLPILLLGTLFWGLLVFYLLYTIVTYKRSIKRGK